MLQLSMAVPELHRAVFLPAFCDNKRSIIVRGFELAEVIDVAAEAVQEIQAIVTQPLSPPGGRRTVTLIHRHAESFCGAIRLGL